MSIIDAIKKESFEKNKVNLAKQYISGRHGFIRSDEVKSIVEQIPFSKGKLEVAKHGYSYVIDPFNYFVVSQAFTFSKEKEELNSFIQSNLR
jgi:hypothetical protein